MQREREGVHALQGHDTWGSSQGRQLRVVAHTVSSRRTTQACVKPTNSTLCRWSSARSYNQDFM